MYLRIERSERFCSVAEALRRTGQEVDVHLLRSRAIHMPSSPAAVDDQNPRRRGEGIQEQVSHAPGEHRQVPSTRINPAAWPSTTLPSQAFVGCCDDVYPRGYALQPKPMKTTHYPLFVLTLPARSPSWDMGPLEPKPEPVITLISDCQLEIDYRSYRL